MAAGLFDLAGRTVVITGGGGALGSAIAVGLARAGATIAVLDRRADAADRTQADVVAAGGNAIAAEVDVSVADDVERVFARIEGELGGIDVLVNAVASGVARCAPEELPVDDWRSMIEVNLTGFFLCTVAAARIMLKQQRPGSIINFSSIAGVSALGRGSLPYSVAKGGILQMTRELAYAWAGRGIRVNSILPAQFVNEMWAESLQDPERAATVQRVLSGIPLGRMGQPEDIVGAVQFLASDASAMVTGISLPVDGGNLITNAGATQQW